MHDILFQPNIEENIQINIEDVHIRYFIEMIIEMMTCKSEHTAKHCIKVCKLSCEIGKALNISKSMMQDLFVASILHDVGKIFIPHQILNKPGKLTQSEYKTIQTHSKIGFETVHKIDGLQHISEIILYHHERYDGMGYPYGLKGEQIPFLSRIIAVADAFDAITSSRPYKPPLDAKIAVKELMKGNFTHFDGNIVNCFIHMINRVIIVNFEEFI